MILVFAVCCTIMTCCAPFVIHGFPLIFSLFGWAFFFVYGLKTFTSAVDCLTMIFEQPGEMPPLRFSAILTLVWRVSVNSDVPLVFCFLFVLKNIIIVPLSMLHVLLSLCRCASRLAKMVMQPCSPCHEHQHALHIMLTYAIDNDCFVTVH